MDLKKALRLAGLSESAVVAATPMVVEDIAQKIAKELFDAAESEVANGAADQNGQGFSGDMVMAKAQEIMKRVTTFLDDLIKQNK